MTVNPKEEHSVFFQRRHSLNFCVPSLTCYRIQQEKREQKTKQTTTLCLCYRRTSSSSFSVPVKHGLSFLLFFKKKLPLNIQSQIHEQLLYPKGDCFCPVTDTDGVIMLLFLLHYGLQRHGLRNVQKDIFISFISSIIHRNYVCSATWNKREC